MPHIKGKRSSYSEVLHNVLQSVGYYITVATELVFSSYHLSFILLYISAHIHNGLLVLLTALIFVIPYNVCHVSPHLLACNYGSDLGA